MKLVIHVDAGFTDYFLLKKELDAIVPGLSIMKDYDLKIDNTPEHKRLNNLRRRKSKKKDKKQENKENKLTILLGCNKQSEIMGKRYAKDNNIAVKSYPIKWEDFSKPCIVKEGKFGKYNSLAAIKRDEKMFDDVKNHNGLVIFMTNGSDPYISKAINKANERGLMVATLRY